MADQAHAFDFTGISDSFDFTGISAEKPSTDDKKLSPLEQRRATMKQRADALKGHEPLFEAARGAVRGAVSTVQGLASPIRKAFGMSPATPPPEETSTAGKVGRGAEQIGEFFLPEAGAAKVAGMLPKGARLARLGTRAAISAAGTFGIAKAQGDTGTGAGVASAVAGVSPLTEAVAPAAFKALRRGARAGLAKVLGAAETTAPEINKAIQKVVPTALDEGLRPSWTSWLKQARGNKERAGQSLETALKGELGGVALPTQPIVDALDELANAAAQNVMKAEDTLKGAKGAASATDTTVVYNRRLLKNINELKTIVRQSGEVMPARQMVNLKRDWDTFVYKASDFANRSKLKVAYEARAKAAAADAVRSILEKDAPTIAELNAAYSTHTKLYSLIRRAALGEDIGPAAQRTASSVASKVAAKAGVAVTGATVGAGIGYQRDHSVTGAVAYGIAGGLTGRMLQTAFASPAWRTLPAATKNKIAQALVNGQADIARRLLTPVLASTAGTP